MKRSKGLISSNDSLQQQATSEKQIVNKKKQKKALKIEVVKALKVSLKEGKLQNNKNNGQNMKNNNIEKKNPKGVNANNILTQTIKKNEQTANGPTSKNNLNKRQNNKNGPKKSTDKALGQKRKTGEHKMIAVIDGVEEKLVHFQGIPIRKSDAERLKELRKTMFSTGIPKSEIERKITAERRKSEKRITRLRKYVCFHCRKSGHLLSDCPELSNGKNSIGSPICFICKEQGHISRECPDNTKGLYPHGGACKLCGDITHFKRNCPTTTQEKSIDQLVVDTK